MGAAGRGPEFTEVLGERGAEMGAARCSPEFTAVLGERKRCRERSENMAGTSSLAPSIPA